MSIGCDVKKGKKILKFAAFTDLLNLGQEVPIERLSKNFDFFRKFQAYLVNR